MDRTIWAIGLTDIGSELGMSRTQLIRLLADDPDGDRPPVYQLRPGAAHRARRADLREWLERRRVGA